MSEACIRAIVRTEKPRRVRRDGFAPGIIYGEGVEGSIPVKMEMIKLKRLLRKISHNTTIEVKTGESIRQCIIKDIQRHPVTGDILHIDLQAVNGNNNVKLRVPLLFNGKNLLDERKYLLHVFITELEIVGPLNLLPEYVAINLGDKKPGDKILVGNLKIDGVKIINAKNEIIAAVAAHKELEAAS